MLFTLLHPTFVNFVIKYNVQKPDKKRGTKKRGYNSILELPVITQPAQAQGKLDPSDWVDLG